MADTQKIIRELKYQVNYADKDYKTLTLPNPTNDVTQDAQRTKRLLEQGIAKLTVGDKNGAAFSDTSNCRLVEQIIFDLDIGVNAV